MKKRILLIDFCDFERYPIGGYLTFFKNMLDSFKGDLALVGISTKNNEPVGRWFKKKIKGVEYDYFALARYTNLTVTKHFIPDRLVMYILLTFYKKRIRKINIRNVFIQRQEVLLAIKNSGFSNICYRFAGLDDPLSMSKYWYSALFARIFERKFFKSFHNVKLIFATGDNAAIDAMLVRSNQMLQSKKIIKFPTRIDTGIFRKFNKLKARKELGIPESSIIILTTGRLAWLKGWKFMIDSFQEFQSSYPESKFLFIGEGEEREKIEKYISSKDLKSKIILVGKKTPNEIAMFLNASDIFIMGSLKEGWSTSLIEAIGCGVPACVTDFTSAKEIITEGVTGFVSERNADSFSNYMKKCLMIDTSVLPLNSDVMKYSTSELGNEILKHWVLE